MSLDDFLVHHTAVMHVRQVAVRGSAPRENGAEIFVSASGFHGTIGGGQLEYMAIDKARAMLRRGETSTRMSVPLGPEIGQCCGGYVDLALDLMRPEDKAAAQAAEHARRDAHPHIYVLGAGHVGRALAVLFQHLPVRCILIDSREAELARADATVEKRLSALPEAEIRQAPKGSAFIVLTHDHALDFLLTTEALARGDAAYVGLIGSATKRAKYLSYCRQNAAGLSPAALVCPIGATRSTDKRPEVIASFVVAEVMARLTEPKLHTEITA
ncbi:xanthine dehydrogenase accessory protein XdhC [Roseobacter sp. YSTF-M11]|uniref:Xanthine dehydrogenase accessory protein XdhC n=1 Tax=Roseobacter insulae TaxID=2859783 RepID=A0A9X1K072_9RHOB|nr:xanthine dehydrogenase accessory protein XdhC [Roseobacter insulae]MBW4709980.1 xanthine dehydrogenase accessory protein XdhC [Roseobacter insulae]